MNTGKYIFLTVVILILGYFLVILPHQKNVELLAQQQKCFEAGQTKEQSDKLEAEDDKNVTFLKSEYVYDEELQSCIYKSGNLYTSNEGTVISFDITNLYSNQTLAFYVVKGEQLLAGDKSYYDELDSKYFN